MINNKKTHYNFDHVVMKGCSILEQLQHNQTLIIKYEAAIFIYVFFDTFVKCAKRERKKQIWAFRLTVQFKRKKKKKPISEKHCDYDSRWR